MEKENPNTYTNRELYLLMKSNNDTNLLQHQNIEQTIKEFYISTEKTLSEILSQTTKHNGRMRSLENSRIQVWTTISIGVLLAGTIIALSINAIDNKISNGIVKALENYNITNE